MNEVIISQAKGEVTAFIEDHGLNYPNSEVWEHAKIRHKQKLRYMLEQYILKVLMDGRDYRIQMDQEVYERDDLKPPHNHIMMMKAYIYLAKEKDVQVGECLHPDFFGSHAYEELQHISATSGNVYSRSSGWERVG